MRNRRKPAVFLARTAPVTIQALGPRTHSDASDDELRTPPDNVLERIYDDALSSVAADAIASSSVTCRPSTRPIFECGPLRRADRLLEARADRVPVAVTTANRFRLERAPP